MASHDYHFVTRWRVGAKATSVADLLADPTALPRWWPAVYLAVDEMAPPDGPHGLGRVVRYHTRGYLPYTLRWQSRTTEVRYPNGLTIEAWGDFVGRGIWTFAEDGPEVEVTFDWKIRVEKPGVRQLSFLLKPIFAANHRWAMERGLESLRLELARRRSLDPEQRAMVPAPPQPPRLSTRQKLAGAAAALLVAALAAIGLAQLVRRRRA